MKASVISLEARKTTYRTPDGEERQTFTGTPDWLYAYMPRLKQGCGWELLSLILHHQRMGHRTTPVAISLTQFQRETGRAIRTIQKGLSDLARVGLLYEELETPGRQESAIRYAILSQEQVGHGPSQQADGSLVVHLLDGPYEVDPTRLITRKGVVESTTLPEHRKNGAGVVEPATQGCEKLLPRGVRNCMNWVLVSHTPPAAQARQEAAPAFPLDSRDNKRESTPPDGGAAPVATHEVRSRVTEAAERSCPPSSLRADPTRTAPCFPGSAIRDAPSSAPFVPVGKRAKGRRSFPGAGRAQPITNVLANASTKEDLAQGAADAAPALEHPLKEHGAAQSDAPSPSEHENSDSARSRAVGAAPAPSATMSKPALFPTQPRAPAPALRSAARAGAQAKRGRAPAQRNAAERKTEEQAVLEARRAALIAAWLAHPAAVPEEQMSQTERRRFYSGIAKLAQSSLTLEELPALLDAQARWSRGTYTPDPHTLDASLGTLRREAATWSKQEAASQKGAHHDGRPAPHRGSATGPYPAGLAGTGGANHDGDAAILAAVQRVRARQQQQEAAAGAAPGHDPPG